RRLLGELDHKPFDREILGRFASRTKSLGVVCDVGCGPGHVAAYLRGLGVDVHGVDVSAAMVSIAAKLNSNIPFRREDMRSLTVEDGAYGGLVAFYSIIHFNRSELPSVFLEMRRVLKANGVLLLAFHAGDDTVHFDEWWGHRVCLDFAFFQP